MNLIMLARLFGIVFIASVGEGLMLGFIANNLADAWLHLAIAAASLGIGLAYGKAVRTVL